MYFFEIIIKNINYSRINYFNEIKLDMIFFKILNKKIGKIKVIK